MNRTALIRRLSLGFAALSMATAGIAAEDASLSAARDMAYSDAQIAIQLQAWIDQRDIALLAQADGLITNDMRASAEQYAVARLVEADGLVSAQLREAVEHVVVARIAAADGMVVASVDASESWAAPTSNGAVMVAAGGR